jgi:hypothetical protein
MCAATFILGFIPFEPFDYVFLFSGFLVVQITYLTTFSNTSVRYLLILVILLCRAFHRLKGIKGHIFHLWLNFTIVILLFLGVELLFDKVVRYIGYAFTSPLIKIIVWGISSLIVMGLSTLIIYVVKYLCHDYFNEINAMGKKYPSIERHFITIAVGILLFYIAAQSLIYYFYNYSEAVAQILTAAYIFSIFLQLLFLTQLFRVSHLRESLSEKEIENMSLLLYSSDLERNFSEIKDIKHDIKNLFFTMGQYVERSGDMDFKQFYSEKIFPFAESEIQKNDLYAKLMLIENEQLRAFLYYKLTQAFSLGIAVSLEVQPGVSILMRFGDIVRILGILIDNALEENMLLDKNERALIISLTGNKKIVSIKTQNKVRPETLACGIQSGVSQKTGDRG